MLVGERAAKALLRALRGSLQELHGRLPAPVFFQRLQGQAEVEGVHRHVMPPHDVEHLAESMKHVATVQNQWCHFGIGAPPILEPILVRIGSRSLGDNRGLDPWAHGHVTTHGPACG